METTKKGYISQGIGSGMLGYVRKGFQVFASSAKGAGKLRGHRGDFSKHHLSRDTINGDELTLTDDHIAHLGTWFRAQGRGDRFFRFSDLFSMG